MLKHKKPMGVGEIIDRSFQVYRQHFKKIFILMLLLLAPVFFLQSFLLNDWSVMPIIPDYSQAGHSIENYFIEFFEPSDEMMTGSILKIVLFVLFVLPLTYLIVYPISLTSIVHLVGAHLNGTNLQLGDMLKKSMRRFWPIVGSTTLFGIIMFSIMFGTFFSFSIFFSIVMLSGEVMAPAFVDGAGGIVLFILFFIFAFFLMFAVPIFFAIKWGFYLPFVAEGKDALGLGKSWSVTKGNFWRIFLIGLILMVIHGVLDAGFSMLILAGLGFSILGQLLQIFVSLLVTPILMTVFAVTYFDLCIRKEGSDIDELLVEASGESTMQSTSSTIESMNQFNQADLYNNDASIETNHSTNEGNKDLDTKDRT